MVSNLLFLLKDHCMFTILIYKFTPFIPKYLLIISYTEESGAALLRVILDADGRNNFYYLEACMRLVPANDINPNPLFLSSGAEDYFLSASYFDEGMFKVSH